MLSKSIIDNFVKIGIKSWLKFVCKSIDIYFLKLVVSKKYFRKVDEVYLKAKDIIYQDIYINKIIIKIYDCNLKFNYRNHLIYSDDLLIHSYLTIDSKSLKNTFFSNKWKNLRMIIEKKYTEGEVISNLIINNDLITCSYSKNKVNKQIDLLLYLKDKLIFLEDINNKKKIFLPLDYNINLNYCNIKNELINIDLSSKVVFEN